MRSRATTRTFYSLIYLSLDERANVILKSIGDGLIAGLFMGSLVLKLSMSHYEEQHISPDLRH